ncbi:hypothetical protein TNCV_530611 [Trichonephila clavipes]|nr:hypothetical protein TNCV_530611 [Trichonephila clavipes]
MDKSALQANVESKRLEASNVAKKERKTTLKSTQFPSGVTENIRVHLQSQVWCRKSDLTWRQSGFGPPRILPP